MPDTTGDEDSTTTRDSCCGDARSNLLKEFDLSAEQINELLSLWMHFPTLPVF
jgi:hypothetical protein